MALHRNLKTILAVLAVLPLSAHASVKDWLYDFTDEYYKSNGIDPAKLGGRKQAPSVSAVIDIPNFAWQRNVRVTSTGIAYGANGSPVLFSVMAGGGPDMFTNDSAGKKAKKIAEMYAEYIFPQRGADPLGLGSARQSAMHDNTHGYFSNNPLGLWIHVWVNYTDAAFKSKDGKKILADLARKNGLALDGTPIIRTKSEIEKLASKGLVTLLTRNDGLRYAVCPEIRDPRDGGVAKDAFYNYLKTPEGYPLEPEFLRAFQSLQSIGDWPRKP